MRVFFTRSLIPYLIGVLIVLIITGGVLSQFLDNYLVLISVLVIEYIILVLMLLHVFDKYIKPIDKAIHTVDHLVKGNYRARIHHASNGRIGELSRKINALARNLSELSIHEQMQSEQLSTVIDNTESGLALIDEKGYIHLVNRKFVSMFGKTEKDYIGYLYYEVFENERVHETVQQTFLYEKNVKQSLTLFKNTQKRYIEIVGAPIFNERNLLKGAVLVFYDITELKKLEVMRKDFVANVSHELKTPITSIKGFAETLLDGDINNEREKNHFLDIIYEESKRIQFLIEDLLTLSKLEKDEFQLNLSKINLSTILDDVIPMIKQRAQQANVSLHVQMEEQVMLTADSEKIKQVLINLLANAISYTSEHGQISLVIKELDDDIQMIVQDTGIGINEKDLPRIFERFYRVDKDRSRNTGGTGLGLAIVKHIVEAHKGRISVESELEKGTTFYVYLPKEQ
ncbi:MAG TPA: ATP-binding protein [Virgibacillus sp.]|nr:ATP-binding protein [Virgibacillus sp.]